MVWTARLSDDLWFLSISFYQIVVPFFAFEIKNVGRFSLRIFYQHKKVQRLKNQYFSV